MIYITGDTHREFFRLDYFNYTSSDILIILGDAGINYFLNHYDDVIKEKLNKLGLSFFCIPGNHEERAENISTYKQITFFNGLAYAEEKYPNLIFAKSGEVYDIDGLKTLVIGGAYSVDKNMRLIYDYPWFKSEQLTNEEMDEIYTNAKKKSYNIILSHTCPYKYIPREMFLPFVDQSKVDNSMELFLDKIEENISYDKWYCGHYHTEKEIDKIEFMYERIKKFKK